MGSLIHKLDYLAETKVKIRDALRTQGVNATDADTFRSYADSILKINTMAAGVVNHLETQGSDAGIGDSVNYKKVQITSLEPGNASILATWTPIPTATKYRLFTYLNGRYSSAGDTTSTSYTLTGLTNGVEYGVYIKPYVNGSYQEVTAEERAELTLYATPQANLTNFALRNLEEENKKSEEEPKIEETRKSDEVTEKKEE